MMPQILHTFTRAIDADVMNDTTKHLCYALNNYYRHCTIYSVKFLKKLQGHATDKKDNRLTAFASQYCGDLQRRLGQIDDAMQLYQSAQSLYLSEQEIVGLSYTTSDLCYLHSLKGEDKKTEQCVQMLHGLIHKIPYTEVKEYVLAKIKAALDNRN